MHVDQRWSKVSEANYNVKTDNVSQMKSPSIALDDDVFGVDYIAEWCSYNEDKGDSRHHGYNVIPVFLEKFKNVH